MATQKGSGPSPFQFRDEAGLGLPEHDFRLSSPEFRHKEDLDFEIAFMEGILKRNPYQEDVLIFLGHAYTERGDYAKGLEIDKRLVQMRPTDAIAFYNLACSYSLLEDVEKALEALRRAIDLGYAEVEHMLRDPHLENVRRDRRFRFLLNRLRRAASRPR